MPRTPRLDYPGARHHVMNRIARKEAIFSDDAVCSLFRDALAGVPVRFGARIHGYALMPNHYHLMIEVPRGNLSRVMRHVGGHLTQSYNRLRGHDGPLFRGRFRNEVVEDDAYWMHLLAYLHLNPVKAGLAPRPSDCPWTSHDAYLQRDLCPDWLTTSELLAQFGSVEALVEYIDDVQRKRRKPPAGFDVDRFWRSSPTLEAPPAEPASLRTLGQAVEDVAALLSLPRDEVLVLRRGRTANLPAWLAVWWMYRASGESQSSIARHVGVSRVRVSQLVSALHERARTDEEVGRLVRELEEKLRPKV